MMRTLKNWWQRLRHGGDFVWYAGLTVVLGFGVIALLSTAASVRSEFCTLCHGAARTELAATPHSDESCNSCHDGANYFEVAERRLAVAEMLVRQVIPGKENVGTRVDKARCLACHQQAMQGVVDNGKIKMSHRAVEKEGWSCTRCHGETGHGVAAVASTYSMESCLGCHSTNPSNTSTCETCHMTPPKRGLTADPAEGQQAAEEVSGPEGTGAPSPWEVTHGPRARELHGMGDLATCSACHIPQFCVSCHQMPLPHPGDYLAEHGPQVRNEEVAKEACYTCHQQSACDSCHQVPMPHPDSYLTEHARTVEDAGKKDCLRCHSDESCTACHERHVHPGVRKEVLDALRARPVN